jgi:hypothetical protein
MRDRLDGLPSVRVALSSPRPREGGLTAVIRWSSRHMRSARGPIGQGRTVMVSLTVSGAGRERRDPMAGRTAPIASPDAAVEGTREERRTAASKRHSLPALRDTMNSAQRTVLLARLPPSDAGELRCARVAQLLAMTQYEKALTGCRLPVPPRLLQEVRLLRRLLG